MRKPGIPWRDEGSQRITTAATTLSTTPGTAVRLLEQAVSGLHIEHLR